MEFILRYAVLGTLAFSMAATVLSALCLAIAIKLRKDYLAKFKETTATVVSLGNRVERMRQTPPKLRVPYEERLKAEYEKRGLKWETTGK